MEAQHYHYRYRQVENNRHLFRMPFQHALIAFPLCFGCTCLLKVHDAPIEGRKLVLKAGELKDLFTILILVVIIGSVVFVPSVFRLQFFLL